MGTPHSDHHLIHKTKQFLADENGAITVDWVVITAGVIALSIGA